jgi:carbamoyl-phosphate synthase large subunit
VLLALGGQINKLKFLEAAKILTKLGYKIFATDTTAEFFKQQNVPCQVVHKAHEKSQEPNFLEIVEGKQVAFVVNLSQGAGDGAKSLTDGFRIRRATVDNQIPLFIDLHLARAFVKALENYGIDDLEIKSYNEYLKD